MDLRSYFIARYEDGTYNPNEPFAPCANSIKNWINRRDTEGNFRPYEHSGNSPSDVLRGREALLVAVYRTGYPEATADEVLAFVANEVGVVYSRSQLTECENNLGLCRKASSTTANQAFTPINLLKRDVFWSSPLPTGVLGVPLFDLVDIDEFGIDVTRVNRHFGKAYFSVRVRLKGQYTRSTKLSVIVCVAATGDRWIRVRQVAGTSAAAFESFLTEEVLPGLTAMQPPRVMNILMDNLNSHHAPRVVNSIYFSGHRPMFRPPYRPQDAPIEYIINQIDTKLRQRCFEIENEDILVGMIPQVFTEIEDEAIRNTFIHCGYT
jgi:transposase